MSIMVALQDNEGTPDPNTSTNLINLNLQDVKTLTKSTSSRENDNENKNEKTLTKSTKSNESKTFYKPKKTKENKLGKVFMKRNDPMSDEEWERMLQAEKDELEAKMKRQSLKNLQTKLRLQIKQAEEELNQLPSDIDENSSKSYRDALVEGINSSNSSVSTKTKDPPSYNLLPFIQPQLLVQSNAESDLVLSNNVVVTIPSNNDIKQ